MQNVQKLKARIQDLKTVRVEGTKFVIKKLNPLIDFGADNMPQIFTDFITRRRSEPDQANTVEQVQRFQRDMYAVIEAGVVEPKLVPVGTGDARGRENGITVEDLFRNPNLGTRLYALILDHSLNRFRGLKRLFFSIKTKYLAFMLLQKSMAKPPFKSSSPTEIIQ